MRLVLNNLYGFPFHYYSRSPISSQKVSRFSPCSSHRRHNLNIVLRNFDDRIAYYFS